MVWKRQINILRGKVIRALARLPCTRFLTCEFDLQERKSYISLHDTSHQQSSGQKVTYEKLVEYPSLGLVQSPLQLSSRLNRSSPAPVVQRPQTPNVMPSLTLKKLTPTLTVAVIRLMEFMIGTESVDRRRTIRTRGIVRVESSLCWVRRGDVRIKAANRQTCSKTRTSMIVDVDS